MNPVALETADADRPRARDGAHPRGRRADQPQEIPARGWKDVLFRVKDRLSRDNISIMAAGVAFYSFLAIPSALTALVAIYGLIFNPADVERQIGALQGLLPGQASDLIAQQLANVTANSTSTLSISALVAILVALWGVRAATATLIAALNVGYEEPEKRGFLHFQAAAFGLGLAIILFMFVSITLIGVLPAIIGLLPFGEFGKTLTSILRWPVLLVLLMVGLAALYRYSPSREEPRWQWVSPGAILAAVLWLVGSALFSIYVGEFASYNKTYGSLGAVVVLLMWLYLTAYAVLLGVELNAELEHQTAEDTTTEPRRPMGRRGAHKADTVAGLSQSEARGLLASDAPTASHDHRSRRPAGAAAPTSPKHLEGEIARTRERMAGVLDAAKDLLSPFQMIHRTVDGIQAGFAGAEPRLRRELRDNIAPLATIGAGLAWLMVRQWHRERVAVSDPAPTMPLLEPPPPTAMLAPPRAGAAAAPAVDGKPPQRSAAADPSNNDAVARDAGATGPVAADRAAAGDKPGGPHAKRNPFQRRPRRARRRQE